MTEPSSVPFEDLDSLTEPVEPADLVAGDRVVILREGQYGTDHMFPVYDYDGTIFRKADGSGDRANITPGYHKVYRLK